MDPIIRQDREGNLRFVLPIVHALFSGANLSHSHPHSFDFLRARLPEGLVISRRSLLKASVAGIGGLSLPRLMAKSSPGGSGKSLILLWMAGGPSQIDTLDPKPDRPPENRGPFGTIQTKIPGALVCEHLPKLANMANRFSILRSVDCRHSNHEPNTVMQTANQKAEARTNPESDKYPAIGALVSKFHGPNHPAMPGYAAFMRSRSHLAFGGYAGKVHDPFLANEATSLPVYDLVGKDSGRMSIPGQLGLPKEVSPSRLGQRRSLLERFDQLRANTERHSSSLGTPLLTETGQRAMDLLLGGRVRLALNYEQEPLAIREQFGNHLWCRQALLARRLVEAGCPFVTLDLSYHTASGTWDTHGDNIPPYGGISKGLKPLLPLFDHLITTLVEDLAQRGLLESTMIVAMGEFGRTPQLGTQGSTDGRNHWPNVMSMLMAGGGMRHGQVIGSSTKEGGYINDRPILPGDIAATIYHHFGIPLDSTYPDAIRRPLHLLPDGGTPIREICG